MQSVEELARRRWRESSACAATSRWTRTALDGADAATTRRGQPNGNQPIGMGWFPGYAIDLGTGERLNMAFGEDSWLSADNGKDMLWNPSPNIYGNGGFGGGGGGASTPVDSTGSTSSRTRSTRKAPRTACRLTTAATTSGRTSRTTLQPPTFAASSARARGSARRSSTTTTRCCRVEDGLIPNDVRIRLRVAKAYEKWSPTQIDAEDNYDGADNFWNPLYTFSTTDVATSPSRTPSSTSILDDINVVPNPYYAFSQYETSKLDNRVKITNLPEVCTIRIYNLQGTWCVSSPKPIR